MKRISLEAARVNANITQQAMADMLGVSRRTVYLWESGQRKPKNAYMIAMCKITGFDVDDIILPSESAESVLS